MYIIFNKGLALFFLIISFDCFFLFSTHYNLILYSLFCIYHITHTHTHTHTSAYIQRNGKRPGFVPIQHKAREWGGRGPRRHHTCVVSFFSSRPLTHRHKIHQIEKTEDSALYVLHNTKQRRHIIHSWNLFYPAHFFFSLFSLF